MFAGYFVFSSLLNSERMQISVQPLANCWNTLSTFHQRPEKTEHENNPEACSTTWSLVPLHTLRCGTLVSSNFDVVPRPHNRWSWPWLDWLDGIAAASPYRPHLTCENILGNSSLGWRLARVQGLLVVMMHILNSESWILVLAFQRKRELFHWQYHLTFVKSFTWLCSRICVCVCFLVFFWNMITLTTC